MAKDPAVLFYTSDFLTGVSLMTLKERGQYITLLCLQHQHGHLSDGDIKKAVGKVTEAVMDKFDRDEDGLWFNRRMETEREKREATSEARTRAINKRWNK